MQSLFVNTSKSVSSYIQQILSQSCSFSWFKYFTVLRATYVSPTGVDSEGFQTKSYTDTVKAATPTAKGFLHK